MFDIAGGDEGALLMLAKECNILMEFTVSPTESDKTIIIESVVSISRDGPDFPYM